MQSKTPPENVRVFFARHKKTGLWKAESPDIKGFLIFDHSEEALQEDVPSAITELLKEEGYDVHGEYQLQESAESDWVPQGGASQLVLAA